MTKAPPKPRRDFPLFAHRGGSWTAKIDGKQQAFGGWIGDPAGEKALAKYNRHMQLRGGSARVPTAADGNMTVRELVNRFLTRQLQRLQAGEIRSTSFRDFQSGLSRFTEIVGGNAAVADLTPATFAHVRLKLGERMKSHAMNRHLSVISQLFRWGSGQELIVAPPKYGESLKKARHGRTAKPKHFTRAEVWLILQSARQPFRAMTLLGLNCGLGNTDIGQLRRSELDLDAGFLVNHRHKTEVPRRCPLWPETIAAIVDAMGDRKVKGADHVFLTSFGNPWVQEPMATVGDKGVEAKARIDSVRMEFTKVLTRAGIFIPKAKRAKGEKPDGRNFYTLRRTFRTLADNVRDPHATALMMGHSFGSVAGLYVQHIEDARLVKVSEFVRARLLGGCSFI
jgi:integrase